jgi:flavodoxin
LVSCFSLSGNTKKFAQAIHDKVMDLGYVAVLESLDNIALEEAGQIN